MDTTASLSGQPPAEGERQPEAPVDDRRPLTMTRRAMLGTSAAAAAAAYVSRLANTPFGRQLNGIATAFVDAEELAARRPRQGNNVVFLTAERQSDLLLLDFEFGNFTLDTTSDPPALVPVSADNLIVVTFPPQAIGEGVYPLPPGKFDPPPVLSVLADSSWLSFSIPATATIPLPTMTVEDVLDWSKWTLLVPTVANMGEKVDGKIPLPSLPEENGCLIECPWGLYLSPVVNPSVEATGDGTISYVTNFTGTHQPASLDGVTECWAATLTYTEVFTPKPAAADITEAPDTVPHSPVYTPLEPLVSAVWSRDLQIYCDETGHSEWVPWSTLKTNSNWWATPDTSQILAGE
ncbi:MAG TPA: hypothetical protein VGP46_07050 [Acidimicrobiales bacterium]|nr:hypothetical protein [Acidimicrobiales bacterium]